MLNAGKLFVKTSASIYNAPRQFDMALGPMVYGSYLLDGKEMDENKKKTKLINCFRN